MTVGTSVATQQLGAYLNNSTYNGAYVSSSNQLQIYHPASLGGGVCIITIEYIKTTDWVVDNMQVIKILKMEYGLK